ncbi:outer membrane beta-barrel protein [Tunturiibacter empetritectus]|uniref:outer membrane beta-barrel protein n=1 Tax=Tunturiibacter empetritectus TaxID=3069691 RepID=UPI003D9ABDB0
MSSGFEASAQSAAATPTNADVEELRQTVRDLALRVSVLEAELHKERPVVTTEVATLRPAVLVGPAADVRSSVEGVSSSSVASVPASAAVSQQTTSTPTSPVASVLPTQLPGGATLNYTFDGYYDYDFNHPIGRVQYLRAYDVLSNAFSINQADVVFALDPDVAAGRRYGVRLDLQFGQATETLQGSPQNEPRPDIYRNIFQVYGTYVVPLGKGLTVDVGKWASSLGIEGNYTKDQVNYSRSFFFNYLPFYHAGVRTSYKVNDKLAVNYWLVNGTDQSEPTNSFKDELFGFTAQPAKSVVWNFNYYLGQDHPDAAPATNCTAPVQPGLCLQAITPAPDGKQHIFDSYVTWNATPKLTLSLEGDYLISREWANAAPGESSAPSHVDGGAAYARYQLTPKMALGGRTEYLSDRGGLFSGTTQALKEFTGTYEYKFGEGFLTRVEYRRDWSNVPFFLTNKPGVLSSDQPTLTVGMVWWVGGKTGAW